MPKKYHIEAHPVPNRFPTIGRSGIVDWGEGCLKCAECVKYQCIYNVYRDRFFSPSIMADTIDELCKNCFRCVQGCPKRLIHKTINPEWEALGDDVYSPEVISVNWNQAETGKIPVSGAGYGGPFAGHGFDSMWTDMSEIVRPTRDGIHGREYISTVVDLGRRPSRLELDESGRLLTQFPQIIRIPIPIVFDLFPLGDLSPRVWRAAAMAAATLRTLMIVPLQQARSLERFAEFLVPYLGTDSTRDLVWLGRFRMVEIPDSLDALETVSRLKSLRQDLLVSVRMSALSRAEQIQRVLELNRAGVDVIHYVADERGYEPGVENGLHIRYVIREVHAALLREGLRDEITLVSSGGLAMAEHVIKAMLCGANLVGIDVPLL
ncbi:MAG: hypothetical protein FJY85_20435, partial [Deltaproteobacteria bacterium]|nr:hypothetical protein [Deltaproteobacteria bacterium]